MDKKTVFIKTAKGDSEGANLSSDLKRILSLIDNKSTADELAKRAPPSLRESWKEILNELVEGDYIRDKNQPHIEPKITAPKFNPLKMFSPKPVDKGTVYIKTAMGEGEEVNLSSDLKRVLSLIGNQNSADELAKSVPPSLRENLKDIIGELVEGGYIRDKNKPLVEPKITSPKFNTPNMFAPKPDAEPPMDDLDFHTMNVATPQKDAEFAAKQKAEEAARQRAELEDAVAAAKIRASAEAFAKAEAKARLDAENAAHAKALAETEAAAKAEAKAKKEAEIEARAKALAEAKAKQEAENRAHAAAKAKQEAASRMQTEQEAARAKAALEAAVRVRAEIETAARAQQAAEAKAKQEVAARMQAQQETARAKAALEAAARAKAEAEMQVRAEIEAAARARLKVEQEAARVKVELEAAAKAKLAAEAALLKAEQEAARIRAEMAATKARAEAEAMALAEARVRQETEEKAKREAESARVKAEYEAALIRAEQEAVAKVRSEAEANMRAEAETARLKAEHEAALIRAEQEAVARVRAEAEANMRAEAGVRAVAEALARQQEAEAAAKREAEELARRATALAQQEAQARAAKISAASAAFEINLDKFLDGAEPVTQNVVPVAQTIAEDEARANQKIEQRTTEAKAETEKYSMQNVAAEMARLKEEAEAVRRKAEEDARRESENQALEEDQAKAWAEAEQRARVQAIIEAEQDAQQTALSQARGTQHQVSRVPRKPLPLGKIVFGLFTLALLVAVLLPYVYPLDEYIAPLEQHLSARLKQPVHIGEMSASSLPPRLRLQKVTVGNAQEVKVGIIVLNFGPLSLFSDIKVIDNAELQDVSIPGYLLDKQAASLKLLGANAHYPVRHLTLLRVKIVTDEVALPVLNGIADIDAQGMFSRVALHSSDDKLGIDLQPNQGRWQLSVNLKESSLPAFPDIVFSDLSAKGELTDGEVNFTEMDAHIFNGILLGGAKLNWRKGWQLQGHFEAKTFDLNKMFPKYRVDGDMYGEGSFAFAGAKLSQFDDTPHLDGSFNVKNGTVSGFDMVETTHQMSRENLVGGRTRFDEMIGLVQLDNHVCHFRQLKIVSGTLSANGFFDVSSGNQLGGNFSAEIKMRAGKNTLTLYGTLAEPKMRFGN